MSRWRVPLADVVVSEDDIAAVADVYRSGWLSMGPATEEFEAQLASYTGARHALATANGTAALHLICLAVGLGPGDQVIVPSLTFVATVNAIAYTGAQPVFADIVGALSPWLSADAVEPLIGPRTRAIMNMPYGGHPGDVKRLLELADSQNLILLQDAAHGLGARVEGRELATLGAAGAFSFFSNKNLAVGEGGAAVTDDDDLAERMQLLRSHGMTTLTWDRHRGHATGYDVVALGYNYRIDEPRAALAGRRLRRLDRENQRRRELDARYRERLDASAGIAAALDPVTAGGDCAHHLFTVVLDPGRDREAFRAALAARGIQTSLHYPPVHRFSTYRGESADLALTDAYGERSVTLPMFAGMTDAQQDEVLDAIDEALLPEIGSAA